jgi:hypothetical protein
MSTQITRAIYTYGPNEECNKRYIIVDLKGYQPKFDIQVPKEKIVYGDPDTMVIEDCDAIRNLFEPFANSNLKNES